MKSHFPQTPIVVTYFSPSFVKNIEAEPLVDVSCALPWDFTGPCLSFLDHFKPKALFIARSDLWPEILYQCEKKSIPSYLFSAQCNPSKNSVHKLFKRFTQFSLYKRFTKIYCVNKESTKNFHEIFSIPYQKLHSLGDTRYDQVFYRIKHSKTIKNLNPQKRPHFILGSGWPEDEKFIFTALKPFITTNQLQLSFCPHQPTSEHIESLKRLVAPLKYNLYSKTENFVENISLIDQTDILAETYLQCDFCFMGGSIKRKVHSVMEPLAAGLVVFVGGNHFNNPEALLFKDFLLYDSLYMVNSVSKTSDLSEQIKLILTQNQIKKSIITCKVQSFSGASQKIMQDLLTDTHFNIN